MNKNAEIDPNPPLIVDAHEDLAWNMLTFGRDYLRSVEETRQLEAGSDTVVQNGDTMLGWPEVQQARLTVVFATLFAAPSRWRFNESETQIYKSPVEANRLYRGQLDCYHRLVGSHPGHFNLITNRKELEEHLKIWDLRPVKGINTGESREEIAGNGSPLGMVILMEGADGIRDLDELADWYAHGLRILGPAWVATRFTGGWREPGPLTEEGLELLKAMANFNFILDLSHMDEQAALQAADDYAGPVVATHGNCLSLLPNYPTNRQFSDRLIQGVIARDGVVGLVPYNIFLKVGWTRGGSRRDEVLLSDYINHIDYVCQLAGDSLHAGIGTDFDGGFGLQSTPMGLNSIADLQKLPALLSERGYTRQDVSNILGGNWLSRLKKELP